jgi:nicotinamidase-related amidase
VGAFSDTGLAEHLKELTVTQVVLAGIATSIGVESTARQAHEARFQVTLAVAAMNPTLTQTALRVSIGTTECPLKLNDPM